MSDHSMQNGDAKILQRLDQIFTDIATLLDYLGRLNNGRLQAHFDDTRSAVTEAVQFRAVPPCRSYAGFLARLAWLGTAVRMGQWPAKPMPQQASTIPPPADAQPGAPPMPSGADQSLDDIPFLVWSRDFLAAVAAPATVESIEVTRAYVQARTRHRNPRRAWQWVRRDRADAPVAVDATAGTDTHSSTITAPRPGDERLGRVLLGERLAHSVGWLEGIAITAVLAALLASTYALSGQSILNQQQSEAANYAKLNQDIETILKDSASSIPTADRIQTISTACDGSTPAVRAIVANVGMSVPATDCHVRFQGLRTQFPFRALGSRRRR